MSYNEYRLNILLSIYNQTCLRYQYTSKCAPNNQWQVIVINQRHKNDKYNHHRLSIRDDCRSFISYHCVHKNHSPPPTTVDSAPKAQLLCNCTCSTVHWLIQQHTKHMIQLLPTKRKGNIFLHLGIDSYPKIRYLTTSTNYPSKVFNFVKFKKLYS